MMCFLIEPVKGAKVLLFGFNVNQPLFGTMFRSNIITSTDINIRLNPEENDLVRRNSVVRKNKVSRSLSLLVTASAK